MNAPAPGIDDERAHGHMSVEGRTVGILYVTLAAVVLGVRLSEYMAMRRLGDPLVGAEVWSSLPVPALAAALTLLVAAALRAAAGARPALAGAATAAAGLVVWTTADLATPTWLDGWLNATVLEYLRWDMALVAVAGLASYAALMLTAGPARRLAGVFVPALAAAMALFYLLEYAVMRSLGIPGLYYPLSDFAANAAGIAPLVAGEAAAGGWVLFAAPVLLACAPLLGRRRAAPRPDSGRAAVRMAAWLMFPSLAVVLALPVPAASRHVESAAGRFLASAWAGMRAGPELSYEAPFDAAGLRLEPADASPAVTPLNVVVLVLESVRATSTTPYAPGLTSTPFLDSLSRAGMLVEEMYATASYTNKALVSIFAGIPPSPEALVTDAEAFPGGVPAAGLPGLLAGAGYRTAFITPAEMEFERKDIILENLGFQEYLGDGDFATRGFVRKAYFGYEDRIVLDRTFEWVDSTAESGSPFFLGLLTLSSHHPYDLPAHAPRRDFGSGDEHVEAYLNSLVYTDQFVESIYTWFHRRGLLDSTIFVILGDHGEAFGEHAARTHGDVIWDEALHVPAIVVGPGIEPGSRALGLRTNSDVVPTIVELLGMRLAGGTLPALSLMQPVPADRTLYHATKNGRIALALRRGPMKYIYWGGRQPMQAFDLARDPGERLDIAPRTDPAVLRAVEAELVAWRAGVAGAYREAREGALASR